MDSFVLPGLFGLLIESVVFYVDRLVVQGKVDWRLVAALVISVAGTLVFGIDAFAEAGFHSQVPFVGAFFTGLLFSRAANVAHGLAGKLGANL